MDSPRVAGMTITTIRTLAADAVEQARSGHPGMPMGAAPMAYALWSRYLRHNPANPRWVNRDRFVLSAGHGSMLLYALLHLTGYDLPIGELMRFRQWGSKAAGHPEYGLTPGVEVTTGPLGQGFATAVGIALAERHLAARYNRPDFPLVDHYTYAIVSDGDLMEGVSSEAASLAAVWRLGKLIYLYDDNKISIEGSTDQAFTEDVLARFQAYGWHTVQVSDGNNVEAIAQAIAAARSVSDKPSLIAVRTQIGFGSPNRQGTSKAHSDPLGAEELRLTKAAYGWPDEPPFHVPDEVREWTRGALARGEEWQSQWDELWQRYQNVYPDLAQEVSQAFFGSGAIEWPSEIAAFPSDKPLATRQASGTILNVLAGQCPVLLGGSADLGPSNGTRLNQEGDLSADHYAGRNLHFGVREHAMGSILNGLALSGLRAFGGTFLVFSDYMRPAIRMAALMEVPVTYIFTHDSIGVGEDGPTHQPIEHLASLRAMPNLIVVRPADAHETVQAWKIAAASTNRPVALVLTRQALPILDPRVAENARYGGYVVSDPEGAEPQGILVASGSEVHVALKVQAELAKDGLAMRVVSMPSWEIFDQQSLEYRRSVLPPSWTRRIAIEAASPLGWERYVGYDGMIVGMPTFGASAPAGELFSRFGFAVDDIVGRIKEAQAAGVLD